MEQPPSQERNRLTLQLDDDLLLTAMKQRITAAETYWNSTKKLPKRRKKLERYWQGLHEANDNLYTYQTPYTENLVFMQVEHGVNSLNARVAEPVVEAKNKSLEATEAVTTFQPFLKRWVELNRIIDLARVATRHNMLKLVGILKVYWDENAGPRVDGAPIGDVVVSVVEPENVLFDPHTRYFGEPPLIAEKRREPLEDIIRQFPDKEKELLKKYNLTKESPHLGNTKMFWEVHFSYWEGKLPHQGVVYFDEDIGVILGKQRTPFWDDIGEENFETNQITYRNILDAPEKMYPILSAISLGTGIIDDTSSAEQILPLQDIVDKRGRQINQAGDDVRGGWVISEDFMDRDEAAEFINDPLQSLWGKGDVGVGAQRLPPPPLPAYVPRSMIDARNAIDNIFGFHGTSRGERGGTDQPTTIQILKEGDFERQDGLVAGIDRLMEKTYQYIAHLMSLKYTEAHWQHYGVVGGLNMISHVKNIYVKAGTTLPTDKLSQREEAKELMSSGKIDYESFFERMGWPDPKTMARRLFLHEHSPQILYVGKDDIDLAQEHIEMIRAGNTPVTPDEITADYVAALNAVLRDESRLAELSLQAQVIFSTYMQKLVETANRRAQAENQGAEAANQAMVDEQASGTVA